MPQHLKHRCPGCGYTYDEALGDDHEGYPPGHLFADLPDDFVCPDCAVRYKEDFVKEDFVKEDFVKEDFNPEAS